MDIESRIQNGLHSDKVRMRQFIKDTALFVLANDPSLDEEAKARVSSLRIRESENGDFKSQIGLYIVRLLRNCRRDSKYENDTRSIVQSLMIVTERKNEFFKSFDKIEDYVSARCRAYFKTRKPDRYLFFLATICEFCSKIAEVKEHERLISYVLQRAGHYMTVYKGAFPGYEELADYAEAELQNMLEF